jgi:hypothetical protein
MCAAALGLALVVRAFSSVAKQTRSSEAQAVRHTIKKQRNDQDRQGFRRPVRAASSASPCQKLIDPICDSISGTATANVASGDHQGHLAHPAKNKHARIAYISMAATMVNMWALVTK